MNRLAWLADIPEDRLLGHYSCGLPGPLILAVGGVHGNEPNGPRAIKAFASMLQTQAPLISGSFLGLLGNVRAHAENQRYIDRDLNRCFLPGHVSDAPSALGHEAGELQQLAQLLHRLRNDFEDVCFVDCHTTSAQTMPYLSINVHPLSIQLANRFPLNNVIGLQQSIPGCLTEYCNHSLDFRGFTFEAGQHQSAAAFSNQVAMLWLMLVYAGALSKHDLKTFRHYEKLLGVETPSHKRSFRLISHYRIKEGEDFVMRPGFRNFDIVHHGMHLADNRYGPIHAPDDGYLLMPLYQKKGSDGFFLLDEESSYSQRPAVMANSS